MLKAREKTLRVYFPLRHKLDSPVSLLGKYRSRLEILRDILFTVSVVNGAKKTHIMYRANLGGKVLNRHLGETLKVGLLKCDGESHYWLTDKGEHFLKLYEDYDRSRRDLKEQTDNLEKEKKALIKILLSGEPEYGGNRQKFVETAMITKVKSIGERKSEEE